MLDLDGPQKKNVIHMENMVSIDTLDQENPNYKEVTEEQDNVKKKIKTEKAEKPFVLTGKGLNRIITGPVKLADGLQLKYDTVSGTLVANQKT